MSESELSGPGHRSEAGERAAVLTRECGVFCRYLLAVEPTAYVTGRYLAAHEVRPDLGPGPRFDPLLVRLAAAGPLPLRACDAYARMFAPRGLLRRKLSLLLAILESSPGVHRRVDAVDRGSRARIVTGLIGQLAIWLASLALGVVLLAPVHLTTRILGEGRREIGPETGPPPSRGRS